MRAILGFAIWLVTGCQTLGGGLQLDGARPAPTPQAQATFERLKTLAGEWTGTMGRGDTLQPAQVSFFVTGRGTAVVERMVIEDPVEMVSVYHLERGQLVMSHYCAAGNQPRMVLSDAGREGLHFAFARSSSLDASRDLHMHARELLVSGTGQLAMVWETWVNGRVESRDTLFLKRR